MSLLHFRFKERRRTVRVSLQVGLLVRWHTESGEQFMVKAKSQSISREGGLFAMDEPVVVGQRLHLVNENTGASAECKVATIRKSRDGKTYVGIEFASPEANFWHMRFPIPGSRPLRLSSSKDASAKILA
ncbi:MAG: PilZ domain-containing protein [Acidobacteriota bacterium]|nr:PilZ domain-containing protein [Acidobacteriota bacterium]